MEHPLTKVKTHSPSQSSPQIRTTSRIRPAYNLDLLNKKMLLLERNQKFIQDKLSQIDQFNNSHVMKKILNKNRIRELSSQKKKLSQNPKFVQAKLQERKKSTLDEIENPYHEEENNNSSGNNINMGELSVESITMQNTRNRLQNEILNVKKEKTGELPVGKNKLYMINKINVIVKKNEKQEEPDPYSKNLLSNNSINSITSMNSSYSSYNTIRNHKTAKHDVAIDTETSGVDFTEERDRVFQLSSKRSEIIRSKETKKIPTTINEVFQDDMEKGSRDEVRREQLNNIGPMINGKHQTLTHRKSHSFGKVKLQKGLNSAKVMQNKNIIENYENDMKSKKNNHSSEASLIKKEPLNMIINNKEYQAPISQPSEKMFHFRKYMVYPNNQNTAAQKNIKRWFNMEAHHNQSVREYEETPVKKRNFKKETPNRTSSGQLLTLNKLEVGEIKKFDNLKNVSKTPNFPYEDSSTINNPSFQTINSSKDISFRKFYKNGNNPKKIGTGSKSINQIGNSKIPHSYQHSPKLENGIHHKSFKSVFYIPDKNPKYQSTSGLEGNRAKTGDKESTSNNDASLQEGLLRLLSASELEENDTFDVEVAKKFKNAKILEEALKKINTNISEAKNEREKKQSDISKIELQIQHLGELKSHLYSSPEFKSYNINSGKLEKLTFTKGTKKLKNKDQTPEKSGSPLRVRTEQDSIHRNKSCASQLFGRRESGKEYVFVENTNIKTINKNTQDRNACKSKIENIKKAYYKLVGGNYNRSFRQSQKIQYYNQYYPYHYRSNQPELYKPELRPDSEKKNSNGATPVEIFPFYIKSFDEKA